MVNFPTLRHLRGVYERWRRRLRTAVLKPILVGNRTFRETVLNAVGDRGHLIYCRNGDVSFFVDPADRAVGAELIWGGEWQRRELEGAAKVLAAAGRLPRDPVFVDAGANIGTQTVYALRAGFARSISFEPEPANAKLLAMNVAANGFTDRAQIIQKAVGDTAGTAVLYVHPRNKGHHTIGRSPSYDGLEQVEVPVVRLDVALTAAGVMPAQVGLIWIDVEGYEPQAIGGLGAFLDHSVPLAIEYSPTRYSATRQRDLLELLTAHYRAFRHLGSLGEEQPISALGSIVDGWNDVLVF